MEASLGSSRVAHPPNQVFLVFSRVTLPRNDCPAGKPALLAAPGRPVWRVRSKDPREEKLSLLFVPVIFSAGAQLLVKGAAKYEVKTTNWLIFTVLSLVSYVVMFVLYSFTVRNFPTVSLVPLTRSP
jgi:hypothetical protein